MGKRKYDTRACQNVIASSLKGYIDKAKAIDQEFYRAVKIRKDSERRMMDNLNRIKDLITQMNRASDAYYNASKPVISDREYDELFDELRYLENRYGVLFSNSPTQNVGYEVKSKLEKVQHNYPLLSLNKTKDIGELKSACKNKQALIMHKLDGLTVCLTYESGELTRAESRGNGEVGELITHNARVFKNIPLSIPYKGRLVLTGEAIITYNDFEKINENFPEEEKYKNVRNLCSGSVRQLSSEICKQRSVKFIAFNVLEGELSNSLLDNLLTVYSYGFEIVQFHPYSPNNYNIKLEQLIEILKNEAVRAGYPIDGMVMMIDDIEYGNSLGRTEHHFNNGIAYKFYDETYETTLTDIEWSTSRTGSINPVAIFEPVEIDGTTVSRASLHNLSIMEKLKLGIGDTITVYKANMIIPQVADNLTRSDNIVIPKYCPDCGGIAIIEQDNDTKVLSCTNKNCNAKLLGKLVHFVSKPAMNIDGLSEATLKKFVELGWLSDITDVYKLYKHKMEMLGLEGFGNKSVNKLLIAIEESKKVKLENFLVSLGIPNIGKDASKKISKVSHYDFTEFMLLIGSWFDFDSIEGIGEVINKSLHQWWNIFNGDNDFGNKICGMAENFTFIKTEAIVITDDIKDLSEKTFVITGSLETFKNRDEAKEEIEILGGKVSGSVSAKTSYLVNNDVSSNSGKNKKAKELGVPIISEQQLLQMVR